MTKVDPPTTRNFTDGTPSSTSAGHDLRNSTNLYKSRQGHLLSWSNLRVEGSKKKVLLDNIQGKTRPGKLTAIMGHSGSGKTTLLKALTGRLSYSGDIFVDGVQMDPSAPVDQQKVAFVAQTDTLDLYSTVHEVVEFSARLRLPKYKSEASIQQLVTDILKDLKLDQSVDTQSRHLSGGERRRLSIGVELVTRPSVVVLDEPTSGLDSYNATMILECLQQVGASGATVLLSIHHPNLQMFQTLDHIILLHGGRCLLQASVVNIPGVFQTRGLPVPPGTNPADWMLEVSQRYEPEVLEKEYGFFDSVGDSHRASSASSLARNLSVTPTSGPSDEPPKDRSCSYSQELGILLGREWKRRRRARMATLLSLAMPVACSLLMGFVFQGVARDGVESLTSFQSHVGALYFNLLSAIIVAPGIMMDFVDQRPLFEREYRTNHYALSTYALSKAAADALITLVQCILVTLTSFWTIGFQGSAWYFVIVYWSFAYSLVSVSLLMGAIVTDLALAKEFIGLAIFPQTLLSGFFVSVTELPNWLQWTPYVIPLTYAFRLAAESELSFCGVPSGRDEDLLKCLEGLEDIFDDSVQYREESVLTLAQIGKYEGRDGIEEYKRITTRSSDPGNHVLYGSCVISDTLNIMVNEVSSSRCNITTSNVVSVSTNPSVSTKPQVSVETIFGWQLVYNVSETETAVDEQHLYFTNPFFDLFGGDIDGVLASEEICENLANYCEPKYYHFGNHSECVAAMTTLPVREVNSGGYHVATGNCTFCRYYHSLMAIENPDLHCAHISWPPQDDPTGNFKCDERTRDNVFFNFSSDEWKMFRRHAISVGIDDDAYARVISPENRRECVEISATTIFETLADADEFVDLNLVCYGFLDTNDATADKVGIYWVATFVFIAFFRIFGAWALRYQSLRRK